MSSLDVIIPTRDRPELAPLAIRSALSQTHRDLVVWVVDAGSRLPLSLPADLGDDPRLHLIRSERPLSAGEARNLGIAQGRAPLIAFLDDDDRWLPDKSERQIALLGRQRDHVALVSCAAEIRHPRGPSTIDTPDPGPQLTLRLLEHPVFAPSATIVRRSAIERVGGFPTYAERTEDWALWLELAEHFEAVVLPEVLVVRRDSATSPQRMLAGFEAFHAHVRPRVERLPPPLRRRILARQEFDRAVQVARAGRTGQAAAALARAWLRYPRSALPALHLLRTLTGERTWQAVADYTRSARAS